MTGILCVDKPPGPTSHDVVARARRALGTRRVGHFGTLDPFASGLVVCGVGPATRLASFAASHPKTYLATVRLGWTSDTDDSEGDLAPTGAVAPSLADVEAARDRWIGAVDQIPPAYSAKHVEGRRAYALARAGETVELAPAPVRIDRIDVLRYAWPDLELEVECGPGTYIRALARDLGSGLGTGGYCAALRRTRSGPFAVEDALAWDDLDDPGRAQSALAPAESAVAELPVAELDEPARAAVVAGRALPAPPELPADARWVRLRGPGGFVGLAERVDAPDGGRIQPRRILYPGGEAAEPS
ncbi:MAG TPA: tRNA pseudouridine(55) synthase TruB [Gemmatimonadota bacterium]|nr:tRNA pseudouridine(55) synthase TruB [Gemmatimonadota bacterium]